MLRNSDELFGLNGFVNAKTIGEVVIVDCPSNEKFNVLRDVAQEGISFYYRFEQSLMIVICF